MFEKLNQLIANDPNFYQNCIALINGNICYETWSETLVYHYPDFRPLLGEIEKESNLEGLILFLQTKI